MITENTLLESLSSLPASLRKEVEAFVVNSIKVKMIKKLDSLLEVEGRVNARKLFLVPIFTVKEMTQKVEKEAPEIKTLFYKELFEVMWETRSKIKSL